MTLVHVPRTLSAMRLAAACAVLVFSTAVVVWAQPGTPTSEGQTEVAVIQVADRSTTLDQATSYLHELVRAGVLDSTDATARTRALQDLVNRELLIVAAEREGLGESKEIVRHVEEAAVQTLIQQAAAEGVEEESTLEETRRRFEEDADRFRLPELRRAHYIRVATEQAATELIEELTGQGLKAFREAAKEKSLDGETNMRGGDLRYFDRQGQVHVWNQGDLAETPREAKVHEALVSAAFSVDERGELAAEPVALEGAYGVLMLTGIRPERNRSFEEASPSLIQEVQRERQRRSYEALLDMLRERHQPTTFPSRIAPIRL